VNTQLHQRIHHARKRARLTLTHVAEALGLSVSSVHQWESADRTRGTSPSSANLRKLAPLLGVSLEWLGSDESTLEALDAPVSVAPLRGGGRISVRPGGLAGIMEITAPEEMELVRSYRRTPADLRPAALAAVKALAATSARKKGAS